MAGTAIYNKIGNTKIADSTRNILNNSPSGTAQQAIKNDTYSVPVNDSSFVQSLGDKVRDKLNGGGSNGSGSGNGLGGATAAVGEGASDFDLIGYMEALQAQRRADAEAAYARAKAQITAGYDDAIKGYGETLSSGQRQLGRTYDSSRNKLNQQASDAFQQAYINRMMAEKNLTQRLAAMGISGGASESTVAGLINNYGNARNSIQRSLDSNLGDLEMNYNNNIDKLIAAYNEQVNNLRTVKANQLANLDAQLASLNANMGGDYYSALMSNQGLLKNAMSNALANQASYTAAADMVANNTLSPVNVQQSNDMGSTATRWAEEQLKRAATEGTQNNSQRSINSLLADVDLSRAINGIKKGLTGQALLDALYSI